MLEGQLDESNENLILTLVLEVGVSVNHHMEEYYEKYFTHRICEILKILEGDLSQLLLLK